MLFNVRTTGARNVLLIFLIVVLSTFTLAQTTSDDNVSPLEKAVSSITEGRLAQAEEILNSVLAKVPNDADALNLLGVVRAKQERTVEAERLFRRAISSSPTHVSAHINLAELLLTHNRSADAAPVLLQAFKLAPARPEINLNLATLYTARSDYARAYEHLRRVPLEASSDDYFVLMLRALVGLKRQEEIPDLIRQFVGRRSDNADSTAGFATLLSKVGFNDDALNILNSAVQTTRSFPILYALGIVNIAAKQFDKADESLNSALALKPNDVPTLLALARVARLSGNLEKALSHLVQARRLAPNSQAVLYEFGVVTLQMGLVLDALPVFQRLRREHPRETAYLYGLAAAHWTKGEVTETTRLMNQYVAVEPGSASGWYLLGAALLRQEHYSEAQKALQRSLNINADVDTEYLLAVSLEKTGNRVAASELYGKIIASRPDHAAAHAALGTAYRESGKYTQARQELERAVELDTNDLRANYQLGLVYSKLGEKELAQKMFDRADELRKRQHEQERVILKLINDPQREP